MAELQTIRFWLSPAVAKTWVKAGFTVSPYKVDSWPFTRTSVLPLLQSTSHTSHELVPVGGRQGISGLVESLSLLCLGAWYHTFPTDLKGEPRSLVRHYLKVEGLASSATSTQLTCDEHL